MQKSALRLVVPTPVNGTVPPRRKPNSETRDREHLTEVEVERLMKAAGENRYGHRDASMILIAFRHGLRPVEVCLLKWDSIDLAKARIHVNRAKNGEPSTHPLSGVELRALRRLKRESIESPFVFVSERGSPPSRSRLARRVRRCNRKIRPACRVLTGWLVLFVNTYSYTNSRLNAALASLITRFSCFRVFLDTMP
jgi:type 1 fimbriae regulatory protein FimB/type 1 fimbriae regulatory protein FimE